jgi:hypothetical protein
VSFVRCHPLSLRACASCAPDARDAASRNVARGAGAGLLAFRCRARFERSDRRGSEACESTESSDGDHGPGISLSEPTGLGCCDGRLGEPARPSPPEIRDPGRTPGPSTFHTVARFIATAMVGVPVACCPSAEGSSWTSTPTT